MAFPTVKPKPELAAIAGDKTGPSSDFTKRVWDYIKANKGIQEGRNLNVNKDAKFAAAVKAAGINPDSKGQITMFKVGTIVAKLTTKV